MNTTERAAAHFAAIITASELRPQDLNDSIALRLVLLQIHSLARAGLNAVQPPQSFDEAVAQSHEERAAELAQDAATRTAQAKIRGAGHE